MALDKVIDSAELDANLTAVADAIRTKGGTTEALIFPAGFVNAVEGIQAGGGGNNDRWLSMINRTATEIYMPGIIEITGSVFYLSAGNNSLTSISFPDTEKFMGSYVFQNCINLVNVSLPKVYEIGSHFFVGCSGLKKVVFPMLNRLQQNIFQSCTGLELAEFNYMGATSSYFRFHASAFDGCSSLKTIIIRNPNGIMNLTQVNAFKNTPFAEGGSGGTVYCPAALITQYQQATNWSTLFSAGTCNFVAIEGSEYE